MYFILVRFQTSIWSLCKSRSNRFLESTST